MRKWAEQSNKKEFSELNASFDAWEAGLPDVALWERLDESISVERAWNRIDESLVAEGSTPDQWLKDAHDNWNPATNNNGWEKLEEELSRERVWNRLDATLNYPVSTTVPWFKMIAATICILLSAYHLSDWQMLHGNSFNRQTGVSSDTGQTPVSVTESEHPDASLVRPTKWNTAAHNRSVSGTTEPRDEDNNLFDQLPVVHGDDLPELLAENTDATVQKLSAIHPNMSSGELVRLKLFDHPIFSKPSWTIQLGTQLSILSENDQSELTNTLPNFGIAADISFNKYVGNARFSQSLGFSQYAQSNGKYINGRYLNTNQRLNTVQFTSTVGYDWKRLNVYGGFMFSRLLSGMEENQTKVTNVYTVNSIQLGLTGGIDAKVKQFNNGSSLSLGAQYQWIPKLESSNVTFENIQGVRFQTKFSF